VIKSVNINVGPILNGYRVMGFLLIIVNALQWTARCKSHYVTLNWLEQEHSPE